LQFAALLDDAQRPLPLSKGSAKAAYGGEQPYKLNLVFTCRNSTHRLVRAVCNLF
jgi:hypothetical protein